MRVDFSFDASDFVMPDPGLGVEAVIAAPGQGMMAGWEKTLEDLTCTDEIENGYAETLVRLSNAVDPKVKCYRDR